MSEKNFVYKEIKNMRKLNLKKIIVIILVSS